MSQLAASAVSDTDAVHQRAQGTLTGPLKVPASTFDCDYDASSGAFGIEHRTESEELAEDGTFGFGFCFGSAFGRGPCKLCHGLGFRVYVLGFRA